MPSPALESALVRILRIEGELRRPVGAGFLVTPKHILTCAHVVNTALGRKQYGADQPDAEIFLDFPLLTDRPLLRATILHWFPASDDPARNGQEDIAVLELVPETFLPAEARPVPVVVPKEQNFFEWRVRMCGFPVNADSGTYANGLLQGLTADGRVELHHQGRGEVKPGFSGTAAWAVQENAVCGIVVSRLGQINTAYMIPASVLIAAFPEMKKLSRPANPYRGLEAFREKDADLYFGREKTVARIRKVVEQQPFAAVIGASGSGKSSAVFAGLVPALRQSGDWLITHCRPKKEPFYELAAALIPLLYDSEHKNELSLIKETGRCAADLQTGELPLFSLIRRIVQKKGSHRFLLTVDQFEELFTLNADQELIRQYIDLLLECLGTEDFTVLLTMRADFFAAAVSHPALAEAMSHWPPFTIPPMNENDLRKAVEQPAALFNVRFADGLVDLIVRDVGQEPGNLPLLEFCLTQLWERQEFRQISHDAYKAIGGVQQALANHADAVYAEFTESEREQLRHIFLKLVRPGQGTEDTRQVATVGQIAAEYRGLITRLADKRLIVTGRDEERGEETVEVVHEALIRRWQTLRQWVDEEREFLVWQEKLRVQLGQWEESGQDEGALLRGLPLDEALRWRETHDVHLADGEREFIGVSGQLREKEQQARKRRGQYLVIGLAGAIILAVLAGVFGLKARQQQVIAEQNAVEVEKEKNRAEQQSLAANYNLAKVFEEKAFTALKAAKGQGDMEYKKVVLLTSAVLAQKIPADVTTMDAVSIGRLFASVVFHAGLAELTIIRGHDEFVNSATFSPDGRYIISASDDKTVRLWDTANGKELSVLIGHEGKVSSAAFSPDGRRIVSASLDKTIRLWNAENGGELAVFKGHDKLVSSAAFSSDGRYIVSASDDKTLRLWDAESGEELAVFKGHDEFVSSAAFSPDGRRIVSASFDKTVRLWDAESGKELTVLRGHDEPVIRAAFSPDGRRIVSASGYPIIESHDKTVRLWDAESGEELAVFKGHDELVSSAAFSPDGRRIVSASFDKTVRLWDAESDKELAVLSGHDKRVNSAAFSPNGRYIISASDDKTLRLRDAESGKELAVLRGHEGEVNSAAFSPDGRRIVSASDDKTVRLWDTASDKELAILRGHGFIVISATFSPDGRRIVSASADTTVRLWSVESGKELAVLRGHDKLVKSAAFSPDGRRILSASLDKTVRLWDAESGKELAVFKGHDESVSSAAFSPDGRRIVSASADTTVRLWNVESGRELAVLRGHEDDVNSTAFSPDGRCIVSASGHVLESHDNTVRLWDAENGVELAVLRGHDELVKNAAFSPDGSTIASASWDKTIRLWDIRLFTLFLHNSKPTPLYQTFIEAVKFLWQLDVQGLEIVETKRRTPADLKKYGTLLAPPPPGQSKFDQVLEWAEKQQEK